jgi:hypothetical protein
VLGGQGANGLLKVGVQAQDANLGLPLRLGDTERFLSVRPGGQPVGADLVRRKKALESIEVLGELRAPADPLIVEGLERDQ